MSEYRTETNNINTKSEDTITSAQDINQCFDIPYVDPLDLLGCTFVHDNDEEDKGF